MRKGIQPHQWNWTLAVVRMTYCGKLPLWPKWSSDVGVWLLCTGTGPCCIGRNSRVPSICEVTPPGQRSTVLPASLAVAGSARGFHWLLCCRLGTSISPMQTLVRVYGTWDSTYCTQQAWACWVPLPNFRVFWGFQTNTDSNWMGFYLKSEQFLSNVKITTFLKS